MGFRVPLERAARAAQLAGSAPSGPASRPDRAGARPRGAHLAGAGLLAALAAAGYSVVALGRYGTFQTASYDLVIFDQAVRSYAHLRPGISVIKGLHNGFGPGFSVLGDHFSPVLALLAPLYWVADSPANLLVAQAVLFALAIPPLWLFTRRAFGGGPKATVAAYLVSGAYALSWPIASAVAFDFHEVAFAPVLTAVALERLQAGRLRPALLALAGLLLVKEDMGFLVAGLGVYLAVARPGALPRPLRTGLVLVAVGVGYSVLATYVLIPAAGGRADYYWAYTSLGQNVPQVIGHVLVHPASSARVLITPRVKVDTVLWLLAAFCFLSLASPIALAAVPLLLERMLDSKFPNWWVTSFQYNAYLVVILACAAVDGAARLDRWAVTAREQLGVRRGVAPGTVALGCAVATLAVAAALVPRFAFGPALHGSFYRRDARMRAAAAADAAVPSGVTVAAVNNLGPQLSGRDTVLLWDGDGETPRFTPWVVADVAHQDFTFPSVRAQRQRVALLERHGYQVVFRRDGYLVLHRPVRPGPAATATATGAAGLAVAGVTR